MKHPSSNGPSNVSQLGKLKASLNLTIDRIIHHVHGVTENYNLTFY